MTTSTTTFMSRDIPVALIDPDAEQPRKHFDQATIAELATSMQSSGLASPILVRPTGERFLIVHGERRWRAAQSLGWETIPAIVRDLDPDEARWLSLIENIQRQDLTPIEEAEAYQAHLSIRDIAAGLTQEQLARKIGKTQSAIAQKLRLLTLPKPVATYIRRGALTEGHARQLLKLRGWFYDLTCDIAEASVTAEAERRDLGDRAFVLVTTMAARPEDQPAAALFPKQDDRLGLIADACVAFWEMAEKRGGTIPLWETHAFWWATFAVCFEVSVVSLSQMLNRWHDRLLSTIVWGITYGRTQEPARDSRWGELQWTAWWGYHSDLRHAGIAPYIKAGTLPDGLLHDAMDYLAQAGAFTFPSIMQSWGKHAAEGRELRAMEEGATEGELEALREGGDV